jgi:hypothetical protein
MDDSIDKLERDIETLRESIRLNGQELSNLAFTPERLNGILTHSAWCLQALNELNMRLNNLKNAQGS